MTPPGGMQTRAQQEDILNLCPGSAAVAWIAVFAFLVLRRDHWMNLDSDHFEHVRLGTRIIELGGLLPAEPNLWTEPERPYVDHEWLAQVAMALVYRAGGMPVLAWLWAALAAGVVAMVAGECRRRGAGWVGTLGLSAAATLALWVHLLPRPHLLGWWFVALFFLRTGAFERGEIPLKRWFLEMATLMGVWSNTHASFVTGLSLAAGYVGLCLLRALRDGDPAVRPALAVAAASLGICGATLLNPWGVELHEHVVEFAGSDLLRYIDDFTAPDFRVYRHNLALAVGAVALLGVGTRSSGWDVVAFCALLANALLAVRGFPPFALVAAMVVASPLQEVLDRAHPRLRALWARWDGRSDGRGTVPWIGGVAAIGLFAAGVGWTPVVVDPKQFPVAAVGHVRSEPDAYRGRGYCDYDWGAYLSFELERPVYINSWLDHYGGALMKEYLLVCRANPGWQETLDRRGITWALVDKRMPLAQALEHDAGWRRTWSDAVASVFIRTEPPLGSEP